MTHWNYRIIKTVNHGEESYGIYEVYYDDQNRPTSCTENSLTPICDSVDDLIVELDIMKEARKLAVLSMNDFDGADN